MMRKVFSGIFVAILAVHVTHQTPTTKYNDDGAIDMLISSYDKYLKISEYFIEMTNFILDDYSDSQQEYTHIYVELFQSLNSQFVTILEELKDEVDDSEIQTVITCLEAEKSSFDEAIELTVNDLAKCFYNGADKTAEDLRKYLGKSETIHAKVQQQVDDLKNCKQAELECVVKFIEDGQSILKEFEQYFTNHIIGFVRHFFQIFIEVGLCDLKANVKTSTKKILKETVNCIRA